MCLALPGKLISISTKDPLFPMGTVDFGGVTREVNLACVPEASIGDYVVVHVGMALSILQEQEALAIREDLRQLLPEEEPEPSAHAPHAPET